MDNASNALIIVATVLIALIVLSIGVYLVTKISKVSESYEQEQKSEELTKFNSKFTVFQNRSDISAQEIVTLKNYVFKYNKENDPDIELNIYGAGVGLPYGPGETESEKVYNNNLQINFIRNFSTITVGGREVLITFTCGNGVNKGVLLPNGKVTEINFTKNP